MIALLAIVANSHYQATAHAEKEAEFRTRATDTLQRITERLSAVEAGVSALQASSVVAKYTALPPKELKNHRAELASIKTTLANAKTDTSGLWPASFQIITLLSQSISGIEPTTQEESTVENAAGVKTVFSIPPGAQHPRILLKGRITDSLFQNAIVRFDPSVRLVNVTFINCVLILPVQNEVLLTSDLSRVTVAAS